MKEMQGLSGILPGVLTFVGSFVVALFLEKAIDKKREQNIEKAKSLGQIAKGKLCGKQRRRVRNHKDSKYVYARYSYEINGVEHKTKPLRFSHTGNHTHTHFREEIEVYYLNGKVYTNYDQPKWYMLPIRFLPFFIGALVLYITNPDIVHSGF